MKTKVIHQVFIKQYEESELDTIVRIEKQGFEIFQVVPIYELSHNHSNAGISHSLSCSFKYYCRKVLEINQ